MKILVLSNFFPPHNISGYELGCHDIVEGLRSAGHVVCVLTSDHGSGRTVDDGYIYRWLKYRVRSAAAPLGQLRDFLRRELWNQKMVGSMASRFKPDLIYVWCPYMLTLAALNALERTGAPVCYYVSDEWPTRWNEDTSFRILRPITPAMRLLALAYGTFLRAFGALLPSGPPKMSNVQYCSNYLRQRLRSSGYSPEREWIVPWVADLRAFECGTITWPPQRLLYVGQIMPHKGVHTLLESFRQIAATADGRFLTLTVVGGTTSPEYETRLRNRLKEHELEDRVSFTGRVSRERLSKIYAEHDILVFPSEWEEPFSITVVEAMASGLAIVATLTGGTGEIVRDGVNALTFSAGSAEECTACIRRFMEDERLYFSTRLAAAGAGRRRGMDDMVQEIESSLLSVVDRANSARGRPGEVSL